MRTLAPVLLVALALGAAFVVGRGGSSRESLLPVSRAVAEHGKALDRGSAVVFPLSAEEEREIGEKLDRELRTGEPPPGTGTASLSALWKELGLEAAASPLVARFRGRYEFRTSTRRPVNAFAVPGGFVYATEGLLEALKKDPDALLFVLGHEIGHVELGHCADAYRLRAGASKDPVRAVLGGAILIPRLLASLHFSPSQELEADAFAVRLMRTLKRDPAAGLRVFDALGLKADAQTKRGPGEVAAEGLSDYFRTHPGSWERRSAVEREARASR